MQLIDIDQVKRDLSRLVEAAAGGDEIVITRSGKPVARLAPLSHAKTTRLFGQLKGQVRLTDDFDEPLPDCVSESFGGR